MLIYYVGSDMNVAQRRVLKMKIYSVVCGFGLLNHRAKSQKWKSGLWLRLLTETKG